MMNIKEFMTTKSMLNKILKKSYTGKRKINATMEIQERINLTR
jgi:hypothetical protein